MPRGRKPGSGTGNPRGRPPGIPNRVSKEFKLAILDLLTRNGPKFDKWLQDCAAQDPGKALGLVANLAEFCYAKISRVEMTNPEGETFKTELTGEALDAAIKARLARIVKDV